MRRRIGLLVSLVALLALGGGLLAATPAWATPPQHFHQQLNLSVPDRMMIVQLSNVPEPGTWSALAAIVLLHAPRKARRRLARAG